MAARPEDVLALRAKASARLAELRAAEGALSAVARLRLPSSVSRILKNFADTGFDVIEEPNELAESLGDLDALETLLSRASVEDPTRRMPVARPTPPSPPLPDAPPALDEARRAIAERLETLDASASLIRVDRARYAALLSLAPHIGAFLFTIEFEARGANSSPADGAPVGAFAASLLISVATGLPLLRIRPETAVGALASMVGVLTDHDVGDSTFDRAFLVDGEVAVARQLLDREARRRMVALEAFRPKLRVSGDGLALLEWATHDPSALRQLGEAALPDLALALALRIHEALSLPRDDGRNRSAD